VIKAVFSASLFQSSVSHDTFRNHSNMQIWCSIIVNSYWCSIINNGSYYYQFWKQFLLL